MLTIAPLSHRVGLMRSSKAPRQIVAFRRKLGTKTIRRAFPLTAPAKLRPRVNGNSWYDNQF